MKFCITIFFLIFVIYSCGITRRMGTDIETGFKPMIVTQQAMSKFLVESTKSIYKLDSIKSGESIYIHSLKAIFINSQEAFNLTIDNVKATMIKDTVIFSEALIPFYQGYLGPDTIKVKVICEYSSMADSVQKCLQSNYIIFNYSIMQKDRYIPCSEVLSLGLLTFFEKDLIPGP